MTTPDPMTAAREAATHFLVTGDVATAERLAEALRPVLADRAELAIVQPADGSAPGVMACPACGIYRGTELVYPDGSGCEVCRGGVVVVEATRTDGDGTLA